MQVKRLVNKGSVTFYLFMPTRYIVAALALLLVSACGTVPTSFRPADPLSPIVFDHAALDGVLHAHVQDGVVDYPAVAKDARFAEYLAQLKRLDPNGLPTREARLAFWMNAYNAFAMQGILEGLSPLTASGKYHYFVGKKYEVGGAFVNLYGLEHGILRPLGEPRIHFAIVCASRSCPRQRSEAYDAARLEQQLDEDARWFINDPTRNRFDAAGKVAYLSMIFDWFKEDFTAHADSVLHYVARYVSDPALARELEAGGYTVKYLDYDWRLNGLPPG